MPLVFITRDTLIGKKVCDRGDVVYVNASRSAALIEEGAALPMWRVVVLGICSLIRSALCLVGMLVAAARGFPRRK